jgi:CPA2 family monovalent cation:H+ antiporter-2
MALSHDLPLISTVAVGLSVAFVMGLVAHRLRLPPVIGYLLAGIIIGPFTPGFTADIELAEQLAEIGVVLLLFGVGLHFSIQDLMQVRKIAITGAFFQISLVTAAGIGIGMLWGWPIATGAIFGLALSVASTVVILRLLEEHNMLGSITGKIAIGWLIVEDMAMVLALIIICDYHVRCRPPRASMASDDRGTHRFARAFHARRFCNVYGHSLWCRNFVRRILCPWCFLCRYDDP